MPLDYVAKRFGMFLLIVWVAATVNFFLPRLGGQNPVRAALAAQAAAGGAAQTGMEDMIAEYDRKFGLNEPLWRQYLTYVGDVTRLDFNYSIASYPQNGCLHDRPGAAVDIGFAFDDDALLMGHWQLARGIHGLATLAPVLAVPDATVAFAQCHSVFLTWSPVDLLSRIPHETPPAVWRLHTGNVSSPHSIVRP